MCHVVSVLQAAGIEHVLIQLGKEQILTGKVNPRTEIWVTAFSEWQKAGI